MIQTSKDDEMTVGGVYIPDPMNGELQEGAVETIGPGAYEAEKGGKEKWKERST